METARSGRFMGTALIAFFAGTVSCVLTATLFFPDSPSPPAMGVADVSGLRQGEDKGLAEALARIEADLSSLSAEVTRLGHQRTDVSNSSTGETLARILERLEAIETGSALRAQEFTDEGWAHAIDEELVLCLVEHGKAPFDEGVAPILKQASRELAAFEDEFSEARRLMSARHQKLMEEAVARSGGQLTKWTPPQGDFEALKNQRKAGRERTLARFRQGLAAID